MIFTTVAWKLPSDFYKPPLLSMMKRRLRHSRNLMSLSVNQAVAHQLRTEIGLKLRQSKTEATALMHEPLWTPSRNMG